MRETVPIREDTAVAQRQAVAVGGDESSRWLLGTRTGRAVLGIIPFGVIIVIWLFLPTVIPQSIKYLVPSFPDTMTTLYQDISSGSIFPSIGATLEEVAIGLALAAAAGVIVGTAIGLIRTLEVTFYPVILLFQTLPKVAVAPLVVVVFGFGIWSKVFVVLMTAFFPILVGVMQGIGSVRQGELELMRAVGATPLQLFTKVRVPRALPATFAGLQVGGVFALIGAVVGEFVGANKGLGYLISFRSARLDIAGVYSALIVLAVIGLVIVLTFRRVAAHFAQWEED